MKQTIQKWFGALVLASGLALASPILADTIQVTNGVTGNVTWLRTNEYVVNGFVYVYNNAVLTIEPGTVIKAKPGTGTNTSCLIVTAGGKIMAEGTRTSPIIFTAEADDVFDPDDLPLYQRGLWGGVVILGRSVLNTPSDAGGAAATPKYDVFEGMPDSQINGQFVNRFGGSDDNDNSGVLRYCSIRHAGVVFLPNKELNGLSLGAVGRGTTIDHVEMYAEADDGVEFFGGTVNTKYMVSAFNDDDCFDIDQGYRGKNQFWFGIQEPAVKDHGGEWNGEPNGLTGATPVAPFANYEIYNGTWIGAGTNTSGNRGLMIREYAAPKLYNSILTEFGGSAVRVDAKSYTFLANGTLDLRDNIWWNFATNGVAAPLVDPTSAAGTDVLFTEAARANVVADPMLTGISRTNDGRLDPRPKAGSPALVTSRTPPTDGFYTPAPYKGAFSASDLWIAGWTYLSQRGVVPAAGTSTVQVTNGITGSVTWYRTNVYVLDGFFYVYNNAVLTIEPGTVIKAKPGTGTNTSCLIVTAGGKIMAEGTANNPIIFTAEADDVNDPEDLPLYQRGLWGGVVILGRSVLNTPSDAGGAAATPKYDVFEGMPDSQINGQFVNRFGGNDDNDNSGILRYCSIRHAGVVFIPNKELNGLSLGAVGRGTTIDHIEMYAEADDGVEFFGGTVNTKYLVSAFNDDDCFDIDQGYRGKNQFWFAIQEPAVKDHGGEWNGEPNGLTGATPVAPFANYEIYNGTWIGAGTNTSGNRGLMIREYAAPKLYNSILTEFGGSAVRVDAKSYTFLANGTLDLRDNLWWNFATNGVAAPLVDPTSAAGTDVLFTETARANLVADPMLTSISRTSNGLLDPRPKAGSPALVSTRTTPNDGFYTPALFKGAFNKVNWATDWTALSEFGVLTSAGGGHPVDLITAGPPAQPKLSIAKSGSNVILSFLSESGRSYQLQSSDNLNSPAWFSEGDPQPGTGSALAMTIPAGAAQKFYRLSAQ